MSGPERPIEFSSSVTATSRWDLREDGRSGAVIAD
jgi:hypothetical protein